MAEMRDTGTWAPAGGGELEGQHVRGARVDPEADGAELYAASHGTADVEGLWTYLGYGPFADREAMYRWLASIRESRDPLFYTVYSHALATKVGMISILNIVPEMGRAELGH